jgi:hypothetical protein
LGHRALNVLTKTCQLSNRVKIKFCNEKAHNDRAVVYADSAALINMTVSEHDYVNRLVGIMLNDSSVAMGVFDAEHDLYSRFLLVLDFRLFGNIYQCSLLGVGIYFRRVENREPIETEH